MSIRLLIAHARNESACAEELAAPLRTAGFDVAHEGTVLVGDSVVEDASRILQEGGPVVLCGTVRAVGTKWARTVVNAARTHGCKIFCVQMDEDADVEALAFGERIADYWYDSDRAVKDLIAALRAAYPANAEEERRVNEDAAEARYRRLALESCDIVDLANLPESERHLATRKLELRRLYVPLHVLVEARDEPAALHDTLEKLEQRRKATRGWFRSLGPAAEDGVQQERVPIGRRLAVAKRIVVLGDPGAGKTTILRWLATAYLLRLKQDPDLAQLPAIETLPDEEWLPVIIRCRDLPEACTSGALDDVLEQTLRKAELGAVEADALRGLVRTRLEQGRALLLIDGLDEIGDPALRARFAQQLEQIHIAFPDAPIVVTSRVVGYRDMGYRIGRGFEHVTVAEFAPSEKDDFARRWCALTELPERRQTATNELIADIHSTDRIERLTGNPMLLTTMALVKRKVGRLPSRRADLYWEALQVLLNWRPEVDEPIDHREAVPQLEYVAYAMCSRAIQQISEDELLVLLEHVRVDYPRLHEVKNRTARDFLRAVESRTGLLIHAGYVRDKGRPVSVYEFRHLTFQEYLAGLAMVDGIYPDRVGSEGIAQAIGRIAAQIDEVETEAGQKEVVTAENWREAIRLAVPNAKHDEADSVVRAVLRPPEGETGTQRPRAILAAFCLADEPNVGEDVVEEVIRSFAEVVDDQDRSFRLDTGLHTAAVSLLASRWGGKLRNILAEEFLRRNPAERAPVGYALGAALYASHIPTNDVGVSPRSSHSAKTEGGNDVDSVIQLLLTAAQMHWRVISSRASGELIAALDRTPPVAHAGLIALYHADTPWVRKRILRAIQKHWKDVGVRESGLMLVGNFAYPEFCDLAAQEFDSQYIHVRRAAVRAVSYMECPHSIQALTAKLNDDDAVIRADAAYGLGRVQDKGAVEALVHALSDSDAMVRAAAADSLNFSDDQQAVQGLLYLLADDHREVQSAAVRKLGQLGRGSDQVRVALQKYYQEQENIYLRAEILMALRNMECKDITDWLVELRTDEAPVIRMMVVNLLGSTEDSRVLPLLRESLQDKNAGVRISAVEALSRFGQITLEPLLAIFRGDEPQMRAVAAGALGKLGSPQADGPLLEILADKAEDSYVRQASARALARNGESDSGPHLLTHVSDPDPSVRAAVVSALATIGDPSILPVIKVALTDENSSVRRAAVGAVVAFLDDETDRRMLTRDADGVAPFLDPLKDMTTEWAANVQYELNLQPDDLHSRFQRFAEEFGLIAPHFKLLATDLELNEGAEPM